MHWSQLVSHIGRTTVSVSLVVALNLMPATAASTASPGKTDSSSAPGTRTPQAPLAFRTSTVTKTTGKKAKVHRMWEKIDIEKLKALSTTEPSTVITDKDKAKKTLEYHYVEKLDDGGTKDFSGNDVTGFIIRERHPSSLFETYKTFHANGFLLQRGDFFLKGRFSSGVGVLFDEAGDLVREVDYDRDYKFTLENVLRFLEQNQIDFNDANTRIFRPNTTTTKAFRAPVWVIHSSKNYSGQTDVLELDGVTGKVLKRSSYPMAE